MRKLIICSCVVSMVMLVACEDRNRQLSMELNNYINEVRSGNEAAQFTSAKEYAQHYKEIQELGDFEAAGVTYVAPDSVDDVSNAIVLNFDGYKVAIDKEDYTTSYLDLTEIDELAEIDEYVLGTLDSLYSYQYNFAQGYALLIEIPPEMVETAVENSDAISNMGYEKAPVLIREYPGDNTVYLDYDSGYSIVLRRDENSVNIEASNSDDINAYLQKQHK